MGKQAQAITWGKVFAEFVTEHYGVGVQIFVESTGKIHWVIRLSELRSLRQGAHADRHG